MASSADSLSFADDKLKHGGYWAGDQGSVAIDRRWISQALVTYLESCEKC
jgi:hypothetical protein